jgi:hypothetical protein
MVKDKTRVFRELRELANPPAEIKKVNLPIYFPSAVPPQPLQQPLELHHTPLLDTSVEKASDSAQQIESVEKVMSLPRMESVEKVTKEAGQQMDSDRVRTAGQQRAASLLSNEQRKDALSSVRERLAKLRASRGYVASDPVGDKVPTATTRPIERRSYMEPTASSFAKTTTPTRLFLGTPERKKVDEGMASAPSSSRSVRP